MENEKYITIKELAGLKGISTRAIRLAKDKYITREITVKGVKVSIETLQRWKGILDSSNNYELLIPNYHYEDYSRTCLTNYEKQIFLKLLLHLNKFSIGKAISLTQYVLKTQGQDISLRRLHLDDLLIGTRQIISLNGHFCVMVKKP